MNTMLIIFYILNFSFIILHEIESGYEKEWEILHLPGGITGFLLLHLPILALFFSGLVLIPYHTSVGTVIAVITGSGGFVPFVVHKLIFNSKDHFNRALSNILIYGNMITGAGTIIFAYYH